MQIIKIRNMQHSALNVAIRDKDTPSTFVEGKAVPHPALAAQAAEFTKDILRGMDLLYTPGSIDGRINPALGWLPGSTMIVEPALDGSDKVEILSGRHRGDWIFGRIDTISDAICNSKDEAEVKRLTELRETWLDFPVLCDVRRPKDDDERREIIAEGNPDDPSKKGKIVQSYPSRFDAFYHRVPVPAYMFHWSKASDPKPEPDEKSAEGWTNATFQSVTGVRGNFHTTYYALSGLGRHFGIDRAFFQRGNRLKIVPQITQALLIKTSVLGEPKTNPKTNIFGYGFVERYKAARASCKGGNVEVTDENGDVRTVYRSLAFALMDCKAAYKQEFVVELMDGSLDELDAKYVPSGKEGIEALGNEPEKSEAEVARDEKVKAAQDEAAKNAKLERAAAALPFTFEQEAYERAVKLPTAKAISPTLGNVFDLLLELSSERFDAIAAPLAAWKEAKGKSSANADVLGEEAFEALADMLTAVSMEHHTPEATTPEATTPEAPKAKKAKKTK